MGKAATLLEGLCGHALSLGADSLEVEYEDGRQWVYAYQGGTGISIANYDPSSPDAEELCENLFAAEKKPVRTVIGGKVWILRVRVRDSFGESAFDVTMKPAPPTGPATRPDFTAKQGQYLAFIHSYTKMHRQPPAEADLQRYFQVTAPSVHQMILTLERNGLIEKVPGQARSIRLLVAAEHLPPLG